MTAPLDVQSAQMENTFLIKKKYIFDKSVVKGNILIKMSMRREAKRKSEAKKCFLGKVINISENSRADNRKMEVKFVRRFKNSLDKFV